jgi:hypothetical protein
MAKIEIETTELDQPTAAGVTHPGRPDAALVPQ